MFVTVTLEPFVVDEIVPVQPEPHVAEAEAQGCMTAEQVSPDQVSEPAVQVAVLEPV